MRALAVVLIAISAVLGSPSPASAAPPPWYPPMRWYPASSENFDAGRGGTSIAYIVIHGTDGSYASALSWFRDPRAHLSAHYVIRSRDGEITQSVAEADTAFHVRGFNRQSVGIEHEFDPRNGIGYTAAEYRSSATLVCAVARRYGIPTDRAHIIGHSEVPGTDHSDPGPTWDWMYYMSLVRSCSPSPAITVAADSSVTALCEAALCAPAAGLGSGTEGAAVAQLQLDLVYLGHLAESDVTGGTGTFGPRTLAALRAFQRENGIPATGFYGELSAAALTRVLAARPLSPPAAGLKLGDESPAVAQLQRALRDRGYINVVTGYFGSLTRDAVRRFQLDRGIVATGNYGPLTQRALALH